MFEGKLASVLNGVLGEYVHGISTRDLNVAVFKGDIVLKGMRLKVEALNALGLPFRVLSGVVGKLTLQIPWRALGKQAVVVRIEELYVVAGFAEPDAELTVEERTARWEAAQAALKRRLVDEGETNWLAASDASDASDASSIPASGSGSSDGWLAGMLDTILGNLEVTISRIHLRLEGDLSAPDSPSPPDPFALGVTLETLALHSVDENGDPTFSSKGLAERMRKSATLDRFAAYFDVGAATLRPVSSSSWDDVTPAQLTAVMEPGVRDPERVPTVSSDTFPGVPTLPAMEQAARRRYLLKPVRAFATYERKGKREALDSNAPAQRVHLRIDAVATRLTSSHLRAAFIAAERLERDARRAPHAHLRPTSAILSAEGSGAGSGAREWWRFAVAATTLRARREGTVSPRIDRLVVTMRARRRYVEAYAAHVASHARPKRKKGASGERWPAPVPVGKMPVLDDVERDVPARVCVLFRALAHARARREGAGKSASTAGAEDDAGEVARARGGWFGGWFARSRSSTPNDDDASCDAADDPDLDPDAEMSEEDWAQLRRVFDVEGHASAASKAFEVANDALQMETTVRIDAASFELDDDDEEASTTVLRASVSGLLAGSRSYPRERSDHRATLAAIDVHVDGARLVRASGARRSTNVSEPARGSIAADETAEALWGDVANGDASGGDEDNEYENIADEEGFASAATSTEDADASGTRRRYSVARDLPSDALRLCLATKPAGRDAPDVIVSVSVAPAHVTALRSPIDRLVAVLTRHKPAQLAEQEELLRRAVAEGASRQATAARERLLAALADRPVVDVTVDVHAPRVAAPSANTESDPATVFVDLGRVRLRSCAAVELGASAETSKLFNAFKISAADVSAAVAPGPWDPTAAWSASTFTDAAPLIPAFGANATILQALAPVPGHAETEMTLDAGALRVAVSPAKVRQLDAVVAQLARNDEGDAAMTEAETTSVDGSDAFGDVGSDAPGDSTPAMALWMSFGRLRWVPCRARIAADGRRVEVLRARRESSGRRGVAALEKHLVPPMPLLAGGALALSEKAAAGQRRVVVACPDADAVAAATRAIASADERDGTRDGTAAAAARLGALVETSRVLRFQTDEQARRWKDAVNGAARVARRADAADADAAALDVVARSARETRASNAEETFPVPSASPSTEQFSASLKITATLAEVSLVVAAPLDPAAFPERVSRDERTLDASAGSFSFGEPVSAGYLARGIRPPERVLARAVLSGVRATATRDAAGDADVALRLASLDVHDEFATSTLGAPCRVVSTRGGGDVGGGAFRVEYKTRDASSPRYAGVDAELIAALGPLSVAVRRPTLAALASLPAMLGERSARRGDAPESGVGNADGDDASFAVERGKSRVAMSVRARVDALRVALLLDDAEDDGDVAGPGCVAEAKIADTRAAVSLFPSTMRAEASIGSLDVIDPRLPESHPYRRIVRAATDASRTPDALVVAKWETFDPGEEADGATASAFARVESLRVVFLNRLVAECASYVDGLSRATAKRADSNDDSSGREDGRSTPRSAPTSPGVVAEDDAQVSKSTSQANRIRLDVQLDAPVVVVPRSTSNTTQALELDMGALSAKNAFVDRDDERERDGAANETSRRSHTQAFRRRNDSLAADPDSDSDSEARERSRGTRRRAWDRVVARVSGINVSAVGDSGRRRKPLARTPLAAEATVWRRLDVASENSDDDSPTTIVRAEAASVQLDVSSADFRLLSGCVSENLAERPATIPDVVNPAWMDPTRRVASKASVLDEPETPLAAVDERDENAAADDDAKQSSPSPRSSPTFRRPSRLRGWNPSVSPDGPTIATTLFSARVPAVELGLYRGEGRAEPLAMLVVRELAVDVASLEGGTSAVAVAVAAFALEDFRDERAPRTVARGGAVDDSGNDNLGRRLPLLAAEIVTGPAVGGARVDVTLQRLRVEAEPTFLLDVGRVFVPTLAGGGGEAPEDVLPADVRVRPGETFRLDADLELGSTRRVLADAVAGASYVLDGGGRSIVVRESELDRGPLVFVGPGATLEIRDATRTLRRRRRPGRVVEGFGGNGESRFETDSHLRVPRRRASHSRRGDGGDRRDGRRDARDGRSGAARSRWRARRRGRRRGFADGRHREVRLARGHPREPDGGFANHRRGVARVALAERGTRRDARARRVATRGGDGVGAHQTVSRVSQSMVQRRDDVYDVYDVYTLSLRRGRAERARGRRGVERVAPESTRGVRVARRRRRVGRRRAARGIVARRSRFARVHRAAASIRTRDVLFAGRRAGPRGVATDPAGGVRGAGSGVRADGRGAAETRRDAMRSRRTRRRRRRRSRTVRGGGRRPPPLDPR